MFHNVQGKYIAMIALQCFATESCIQLIWIPLDYKYCTFCHAAKGKKSGMIWYAINVENPATFEEGYWPEFYARGRLMKYSMSDHPGLFFRK